MGPSIQLNLALRHLDAGFKDEAWQIVQRLIAAPDASQDALSLAASLRLAEGKFEEAVVLCRRLLAINPNHAETWDNLGQALDQLAKPTEAIEAFEQSIALAPTKPSAYNNLGVVHSGQGRFVAAATAFSSALTRDSQNVAALVNLGVAQVDCGEVEQGLRQFEKALGLEPYNQAAHNNRLFSLHNVVDDPQVLFQKHLEWGLKFEQALMPRIFENDLAPERKLRIGYVSPDFRQHSVACFVESLLKAHSRAAFEIYCYSQVNWPDSTTARLKSLADHWRDIRNLPTAAAVDQIVADQIDILIDLAGHTTGHRLDIFSKRAAPIQMSALGYPGTTGLSQIDARLSDSVADLPSNDRYSSETLARLRGAMHCYNPPAFAPAVVPLPFRKNGYVTFGSFNKLAKISDVTIQLWAQVLKAVPESRLLIKTKPLIEVETQAALAAKFARAGIGVDRLQLHGWNPDDQGHMATYHRVDIALDTYPYNGTTTTCEALWMGVPVITLAGQTHASRVGASLLKSVNLPQLICDTPEHFVACVVKLAEGRDDLARLRESLREKVATSALCDARAYAADVEAAYRELWRGYCSSV